jgi:hypothetical protein
MNIPSRFLLAGKEITVRLRRAVGRGLLGRMWLDVGVMEIATHHKGKLRPLRGPYGLPQTFWHESVHAILYAMGNPLYKDEAFVNAFATLLTQAIETAEFNDGPA